MLLLVGAFFYPVFLKGLIPIPSDIIVGLYYPWFDDTRGFTVGVPVKNNIPSDVVSLILPQKLLAASLIRQGVMPFWNNLILAGTPLIANFQSSVFYPLNILWFFFSAVDAFMIQTILQPLIGLIFMYLLLKNWGLSKLSSMFGAIAFSFSGFLLVWLEYNLLYHVMYWLPFLIFVIDKYIKTKNYLYLGALSFSTLLTILAGYPQLVIYEALAVFLYLLFVSYRKIPFFSFFALLGAGAASFQLLPGYELLNTSNRASDKTVAVANEGFLPLKHLIGFLVPDYFGNPTTLNWWGVGFYDNFATFVGVTAFVLAIVGLRFEYKRKEVKYATVLLIVSLLLSLKSPLSVLINETNILGLKAAVAARALFLSAFAFSILSAFGIEKIKNGASFKQIVRILYIPTTLLVSVLVATYISKIWLEGSLVQFANHKEAYDEVNEVVRNLHIALRNLVIPVGALGVVSMLLVVTTFRRFKTVALICLICVLTLELFRFGHKYITFSRREYLYPQSKITDFLIAKQKEEGPFRVIGGDVIPMNLLSPYGIETATGYESFYPQSYSRHLARINGGDIEQGTGRYGDIKSYDSSFFDKTNIKYVLGLKRDKIAVPSKEGKPSYRFDLDKLKPVFEDGSVVVFENTKAYPRAYVTVDGNLVDAAVRYERYSSEKSVLKVSSPTDGLLVISDQFYPGWFAKVDGVETEIKPVEEAFRGIEVKAGEHIVEVSYKPQSFYQGLKVSMASLVVLAISLFYVKRKYV